MKYSDAEVKKKGNLQFSFSRGDIRWLHAIKFAVLQVLALYLSMNFPYIERYKSTLWACFIFMYTMFGITAGIHRLWSHRAYTANLALRIIVASGYHLAAQTRFKKWIRIHRLHHKYSDSEADPHNSKRGFFFSHVGWLMTKSTKEVREKLQEIDMSDIDADPVVNFCDKYYILLTLFVQALSVIIPVYFWNEDWYYAVSSQYLRYICTLHATFFVNSLAHMWGSKPFDKNLVPVENLFVSIIASGEGWHNYHHVFPWDYRASEFGHSKFNVTATLLDLFGKIGWAYDFKKASDSLVQMTMTKRGDGSRKKSLVTNIHHKTKSN